MRKFLTTSASATFFGNSLYTARIMKDHLEYIVRNQPGMYGVVLVLPAAKDELPREVGELRRFISRLIEYHRIELNKKVNFSLRFKFFGLPLCPH